MKTALLAICALIAVDGDTLRCGAERIRLVGFDAPEIRNARCDAERALGRRARARLAELLAGAHELRRTPYRDAYGRTLAHLTIAGRPVAEILIHERLARRRAKRGGWCL